MLHLTVNYPDDDIYWQTRHMEKLSNPDSWLNVAEDIGHTLNIIKTPLVAAWKSFLIDDEVFDAGIRIHGTYLMLSAYLLENLFKGAIIKEKKWGNEKFEKGLPEEIKTHNLIDLARNIGVSLSDRSEDLLMRLSEYAIWAGRYPAPIKYGHLRPRNLDSGVTNTILYWRGTDIRVSEDISVFLKSKIDPEKFVYPDREDAREPLNEKRRDGH